MKENPLQERKALRLKCFDYSNTGFYFVTLCANRMMKIFGRIVNEKMELSAYGKIIEECWLKISALHDGVYLDEFVIMPNHLHGIIIIDKVVVDANFASTTNRTQMSLSKLIQQFKRAVTIQVNKANERKIDVWQRSYFDRVIRNEKELFQIRRYIRQNPLRWEIDKGQIENLDLV